ncbi:MAG: hypothetical protein IJ736_02365 [Firmicutes bacterium]|nr:hypothetical protein [Bacillota bacterium]
MLDDICVFEYYCVFCGKRYKVCFDFDIDTINEDRDILMDRVCPSCASPHDILIKLEKEFRDKLKVRADELAQIKNERNEQREIFKKDMEEVREKLTDEFNAANKEYHEKRMIFTNHNEKTQELNRKYEAVKSENDKLKAELQVFLDEENRRASEAESMAREGGMKLFNHYINAEEKEEQEKISGIGAAVKFDIPFDSEDEFVKGNGQLCYVKEIKENEEYEIYPTTMIKFPVGQDTYSFFYDIEGEGENVKMTAPCRARLNRGVYKIINYGRIELNG